MPLVAVMRKLRVPENSSLPPVREMSPLRVGGVMAPESTMLMV